MSGTHPDDFVPPRPRPAEHESGQDDDPPDLGLLLLVLERVLQDVRGHLQVGDGDPERLAERVGAAHRALTRFIGSLP